MEEYSDTYVLWGSGGAKSTAPNLGATLSSFQKHVEWSKDIDEGTTEIFLDSIGSIRQRLSSLEIGDPQRHDWEIRLDREIKDIQQEGLDAGTAARLSTVVDQLRTAI